MGAGTRCTMLAIAVVSRKTEWKNPISAPLRKAEKETQSRRAVLRAVEREIGLVREGDEKGHQEAEASP